MGVSRLANCTCHIPDIILDETYNSKSRRPLPSWSNAFTALRLTHEHRHRRMTLTTAPFGLLNLLHTYVLAHATPITWTNWPLTAIPSLILGLVAWLVQRPGTRPLRIAVGAIGMLSMAYAMLFFRFAGAFRPQVCVVLKAEPSLNVFNEGMVVASCHLLIKYLELMLRSEPLVDPYLAQGKRGSIVAAMDLCINSRMIGLWPAAKSDEALKSEVKASSDQPLRGIRRRAVSPTSNGPSAPQGKSPPAKIDHPRHLPPLPTHCRTRFQATIRHLLLTLLAHSVLDVQLQLLSRSPWFVQPTPKSISKWSGTPRILLPSSLRIVMPSWVAAQIPVTLTGYIVYAGLSWGYRVAALVCVGSGLWDVESWEVDLFDSPWNADSVLQLWGRRWHQLFRVSPPSSLRFTAYLRPTKPQSLPCHSTYHVDTKDNG